MQKYDLSNLLMLIDRKHGDRKAFCKAAGINPDIFQKEIKSGDLTAPHIFKAVNALEIPPDEIGFYFFNTATT